MKARISTYAGPPERLDELLRALDRVSREIQQLAGFEGAYVLVDRDSGRLLTISLWESPDAVQTSAGEGNKIRAQVSQESGQRVQNVETYEVWMQLGKP